MGFQQERTIFLQSSSPRPILDLESLQRSLRRLAPIIAESLQANGYWTSSEPVLEPAAITAMRQHSIALRESGRFAQSWSERVDANGVKTRFDKEGVFACEPDGHDYQPAPDILLYLATVISNLPPLLNEHVTDRPLQLSNQSFNAKLAVTSPGGSTYPLHVDNTLGVTGAPTDDTRKLTCILYLNPDYRPGDGGELRLLLLNNTCVDIAPSTGLVIFWSDGIPHEVLACNPHASPKDRHFDRYALTVWLPDSDPRNIQTEGSKFERLRKDVFAEGITWCPKN